MDGVTKIEPLPEIGDKEPLATLILSLLEQRLQEEKDEDYQSYDLQFPSQLPKDHQASRAVAKFPEWAKDEDVSVGVSNGAIN